MTEEKRWRKVEAPRTWRPKEKGEALVGIYAGSQKRVGPHGEYNAHFVRDEQYGESWLLSGAKLDVLFISVQPGSRVQVIFNGREPFEVAGEQREAKEFDLYLEVTEVSSKDSRFPNHSL